MSTTENRVKQMRGVQEEALALFAKKNTDYGDSLATFGPVGGIIRMGDKQLDASVSKAISELRQIFNKNLYIQDF